MPAVLADPERPVRTAPVSSAGWPCGTCGFANPIEASACTACGAGFLAAMRKDEAPLLELPVVGDLTKLSRAQRLGLAAGLALVFVLLVLVLGVLAS